MKQATHWRNSTLLRPLIISIGIHVTAIVFFVFTFTTQQPVSKPPVSFLGAFLTKKDFIISSTSRTSDIEQIYLSDTDMYAPGAASSTLDLNPAKPPTKKHLTEKKKSLKMSGLKNQNEPAATEPSGLMIDIDTTVPKRKPLAIDTE